MKDSLIRWVLSHFGWGGELPRLQHLYILLLLQMSRHIDRHQYMHHELPWLIPKLAKVALAQFQKKNTVPASWVGRATRCLQSLFGAQDQTHFFGPCATSVNHLASKCLIWDVNWVVTPMIDNQEITTVSDTFRNYHPKCVHKRWRLWHFSMSRCIQRWQLLSLPCTRPARQRRAFLHFW